LSVQEWCGIRNWTGALQGLRRTCARFGRCLLLLLTLADQRPQRVPFSVRSATNRYAADVPLPFVAFSIFYISVALFYPDHIGLEAAVVFRAGRLTFQDRGRFPNSWSLRNTAIQSRAARHIRCSRTFEITAVDIHRADTSNVLRSRNPQHLLWPESVFVCKPVRCVTAV